MNITSKIIITDTNIITDLNNAKILDEFVQLDNVYISDMIKNDEINFKTGNTQIINNFKIISSTVDELLEVNKLSKIKHKLSIYDLINYVVARNHNYILATGDKELREFSIKNGIEVIRTLKIIKLMKDKKIISTKKAIKACTLLKENPNTRIPKNDINNLINQFEKELVNT